MKRKKQIDYQTFGKHSDYNYEFAYELGAEVMKDKLERKEAYLKKLKERGLNMEVGQEPNVNASYAKENARQHAERRKIEREWEKSEADNDELELGQDFEPCQIFNTQNFYNRQHAAENRRVPRNNAFEDQTDKKSRKR